MRCFARLIRWAMVASGTRNAFAISAVVRPPTARSVSAIAEAGVSAGWQHMNSRISVSSRPVTSTAGRLGQRGGVFAAPARLLAAELIGHLPHGGLDQPAPRVVGHPLGRPVPGRGDQRLLHGVLGGVEVAEAADEHAEDLRRQFAQQVLEARPSAHVPPPGAPITCRTSIGCWIGTPPGPGAADAFAAISMARASDSTSIIR